MSIYISDAAIANACGWALIIAYTAAIFIFGFVMGMGYPV
jgi:hypothetical protein